MPAVSVVSIVLLVGCVVAFSSNKLAEAGALMALIVVLHNAFGIVLSYAI